jgi:hypothetical protein
VVVNFGTASVDIDAEGAATINEVLINFDHKEVASEFEMLYCFIKYETASSPAEYGKTVCVNRHREPAGGLKFENKNHK